MTTKFSLLFFIMFFLDSACVKAHDYHEALNRSLELVGHQTPVHHATKLSSTEWAWLRKKEILVVGTFGPDYPPFRLGAESGEFSGITADYLTVLSRELGIKISVRLYNTVSDATHALQNGEVDMLTTLSTQTKFEGQLLSEVYFHTEPAIVRRTDEQWGIQDLTGLKVAFNETFMTQAQAKNFTPGAVLKSFTTTMDAFSSVAFGSVDAVLTDAVTAFYLTNSYYSNELQVTKILWSASPGGGGRFAISKKNKQLVNIINAVIRSDLSGDQSRYILSRWSGGGLSRPKKPVLSPKLEAWLNDHKTIKVGVPGTYPPQSYFGDDGHYYGITADLLSWLQAHLGIAMEISRYDTLHDVFSALENGDIDMIADMVSSTARQRDYNFSRSYLTMPYVLTTRVNEMPISSLSQLDGKTLVLPNGYALTQYIKRLYPTINLLEVRDQGDALDALSNGRADATIMPLLVARYYIPRLYKNSLRVSMTLHDPFAISAFAVRKESDELLAIINAGLSELSPDIQNTMVNRWRSRVALSPPSLRRYSILIYTSFGTAIVLIFGFLGWNFYLRKQIDHRKRAEHELKKQVQFMEVLINGMPHPIYVCDAEMRLFLYNDSYLDAVGIKRETLSESEEGDVILRGISSKLDMDEAHQKVMENGEQIIMDRILTLRGEQKAVYHWMLPYRDVDNVDCGVIGGWIDISERRALVQELEQAKELADKANRTKTSFLATMSHEIRTPLNAVIGMLELTLKRSASAPPDRRSLEVAYQSARGLLELIGDILDVARIESGHLTLSSERTNLRQVTEGVIRVFDGLARQKSIELKLELSGELDRDVLVDPLRFRQVLSNLISNAIKFTEQGQVKVNLTGIPLTDDYLQLKLAVSDSGIGISPEDQIRLFQPFVQVKESSGGSGLGLMICRSLVKIMGGELTLESREGVGTIVRLEFSLLQLAGLTEEKQNHVDVSEDLSLPELNILVVDDHPANRLLLTQQLTYLGQNVENALDGLGALALWRRQSFDLVITDCNMPTMNGYALAKAIRAEEDQLGLLPGIILGFTANAQPEQRQRCLDAGMNGCLFKPIELAELAQAISTIEPRAQSRSDVDVFNIAGLMKMFGDSTVLVSQLLDRMCESTTQDLLHLEQCLNNGNLQSLDELAHRIKGASRIIKAEQLIICCERLEDACLVRDTEKIIRAAQRLAVAMHELISNIKLYQETQV